jgi:hypothetical protein
MLKPTILLRPVEKLTFRCADVSGKKLTVFHSDSIYLILFSANLLISCTSWCKRNALHNTSQTQRFVIYSLPPFRHAIYLTRGYVRLWYSNSTCPAILEGGIKLESDGMIS